MRLVFARHLKILTKDLPSNSMTINCQDLKKTSKKEMCGGKKTEKKPLTSKGVKPLKSSSAENLLLNLFRSLV